MNLKLLIRSLFRNRLNSTVILISLSVGIACTNLIGTFIFRELNTDSFHKNSSQIYALSCDDPWENGQKMYQTRKGSAEYMKNNFSEVKDFCRVNNATSNKVIVNKEAYFDRPPIIAASENFFRFFSFELLTNNTKTALESKNNIVISEELALKYFGKSDPVGKTIELAGRNKTETMVVSGIFKKPSENTQFKFEMVQLLENKDSRCYVRLSNNASPENLAKRFDEEKANIPVIHSGTPGAYYLTPLKDTYFETSRRASTEASRDKADLWVALVIALMILGIASFNYLGLLNNTLNEKSREFAIRKVNGGSKWAFLMRLMAESSVIAGVSFAISILLMIWMTPFFNQLTGSKISIVSVVKPINILGYLSVIVFILLTSLLFIAYRIRPKVNVDALKPSYKQSGKRIHLPAFNILQLAGSVILIVCSVVIMKQISYITNKPIGLDREVIEVKIPGAYGKISSVFKEELEKKPSISMVSRTTASPVLEHFILLWKYQENGIEKQYTPSGFSGDEHYLSTLGIQLVKGNDFIGNPATDKNKVLINESLASLFPDQELVGMKLPGSKNKIISGIVKDFHYSNLKSFVEPAFIGFDANGSHLMIKASENQYQETKEVIANVWEKLIPNYPLNIETIGERYDWMHRENQSYIKLIGACCIISIFLSMIGLFAISYQNSQRRTKEIGIRKVNGAKVSEVLAMLNKDFVKWVAIAFVIATPIAYYAMSKWLENFAYKTTLSWWIFALAGLLALGIALLTVSWQSWRAAARNPVEALRYE